MENYNRSHRYRDDDRSSSNERNMITIGTGRITGVPRIGGIMIMKTGMRIPAIMKEIIGKTAIRN